MQRGNAYRSLPVSSDLFALLDKANCGHLRSDFDHHLLSVTLRGDHLMRSVEHVCDASCPSCPRFRWNTAQQAQYFLNLKAELAREEFMEHIPTRTADENMGALHEIL